MSFLDRVPLSRSLLFLGACFVAAFGGFAYTAWDVVAQVGVGGPTYTSILRSKDVVADVLPPPEYIIEAHLVAHQAASTADPAARRELVDRFSQLEREFEERNEYWQGDLPSGPLREALTARSYEAGHAYFESARRAFVPALEAGDQENARRVLDLQLTPLYDVHRAAIDTVVKLANAQSTADAQGGIAAMAGARDRLWLYAFIVLGVLLVAAFVVQRAMAGMHQQILGVTAVARRVADGDLSPVTVNGEGADTQDLVEAIRTMTASLSSLVTRVKQASVTLTSTAGHLGTASHDQGGLVQTLSVSTAETAATSKEISATSRALQRTVDEVAQLSSRAADGAQSGRSGLEHMRTSVESLEKATASISDKLGTIRDRATDITGVVTTMSKVAEQTNLLSVNAAIEAEKAGEQGRGFLVVAREIRRLADQSAVASLDIEHMVRHMQSAVGAGVAEMDRFAEHVLRVSATTSGVAVQLGDVIGQMQTLRSRIDTVSDGVRTQAVSAQQISDAMVMLKDGVSHTQAVAADLKLAAGGLDSAVGSLRADVSRFSVG